MLETKDPAIKLFGTTIPLPATEEVPTVSGYDNSGIGSAARDDDTVDHDPPSSTASSQDKKSEDEERPQDEKDSLEANPSKTKANNVTPPPDALSRINEDPKTPSVEKEAAILRTSKNEEKSETSSSPEKTLKKPDKILPCPRCNSMDTKFCYYNNYNVNQPRHFCKKCQRYWTAGGTMRNVPVGAGRRKNKNSASNYRHITVSDALQIVPADASNGIHHPMLKMNGTVLAFGSDAPLCESMASVLKLAEKTKQNCTLNGFHKPEEVRIRVSHEGRENGDDHSCGSSVTASRTMEEARKAQLQEPMIPNCNGLPSQMPCFPGAPCPYTWNTSQWNSAVPPPAFCPSTFPMPFYPAATYWGCSIPGTWNMPWLTPASSSPKNGISSSSPNLTTLGKHSRDGDMLNPRADTEEPLKQTNSDRCLWIPKTLRIDDPSEAAKSSIWATLGIRNGKADSVSGGGLFKSFQSKVDENNDIAKTFPVLQANPAALSRSLNFHESF